MVNQQHLDLLKQDIVAWNEWRKKHPDIHPELGGANLSRLHLEGANLSETNLEKANLNSAQLAGARALLIEACLEGAILNDAQLEGANFNMARLEKAQFIGSHLKEANLVEAQLKGSDFSRAHMEGARLIKANLKGAKLIGTFLEYANLFEAHLEGAKLIDVHLERAILKGSYIDGTELKKVTIGDKNNIGPCLADIHWGDTSLASVKWSQVEMLGEEDEALQKERDGRVKDKAIRLDEYEVALRTNRQLASVLETQGLSEYAAHFAYHAQKLQRVISRRQKKFAQYLFSGFLDLLAGYGYKPGRSLIWYFVIIFGFAIAYFVFGQLPPFPDALVFSMMAFHGRGFFPNLNDVKNLHTPLVVFAACEAVIGLFIEISFIATFTRKYFGK